MCKFQVKKNFASSLLLLLLLLALLPWCVMYMMYMECEIEADVVVVVVVVVVRRCFFFVVVVMQKKRFQKDVGERRS